MREFTKTEIDLCKKIAKKEKREIKTGDWVYWDGALSEDKLRLVDGSIFKMREVWTGESRELRLTLPSQVKHSPREVIDYTPLWQIHDCLEWLREKTAESRSGVAEIDLYLRENKWHCWPHVGYVQKLKHHKKGKTPLEALLRAVLAVLEEK